MKVHGVNLSRGYYAPFLSWASVANILFILVTVIAPFFIAFSTHNFYVRENIYTEQPRVSFTKDLILILKGQSLDQIKIFSTFARLNALLDSDTFTIPTLSMYSIDPNGDGRPETLYLSAEVALDEDFIITGAEAIVFLNAQTEHRVRMNMTSVVQIEGVTSVSGTGLRVEGDVLVRQKNPLRDVERTVYSESLLANDNITTLLDADPAALYAKQALRNESLYLGPSYSTWTTGVSDTFSLNVTMHVPRSNLWYIPSSLEVFKFSWMQYITVAILVGAIAYIVKAVVIQSQIVDSMVVYDTVPKSHMS